MLFTFNHIAWIEFISDYWSSSLRISNWIKLLNRRTCLR